ncbi:uncharacterized protein [Haliotis cracherodii]|uniref:uncharacterized protein n=1 Tax=Haliotis cracherodii TaxID=6455 RepID=UPI0039E9F33C
MMEHGADPLQELRERCASTPSTTDWNDIDSLVFREFRETCTLTLTRSCSVVDILVNTNALTLSDRGTLTEQGHLVTLSWDTSKHSSYHSTLVIHVNESDSHVIPNIVGVLCKDNFRKLQQFAVMMFKDYKSRIITLKASPLSLELVHVDLTFLEKLRDNVKVVGKNFRNLVLEEVHTDVRFELKENDLGAHGGGDFMFSVGEQPREEDGCGKKRVAQLTPRRSADRVSGANGIRDFTCVKDESSAHTYEQLERKFKSHQESVEARLEEQRLQNEFLRTSLNTIMESLNIGTKISNPHPAESHIVGQCSVSSPLVSRVSGDGEEATRELPKTNDATHVHALAAGGRPNVTSDQREEKALTSKSDKTLFVQKSEPPSVSTSEDKRHSETKQLMHRDKSHFDSTKTKHTQSANQFDNSETSVNLVNPRPTTPELASYNESRENNMFTIPSPVLNTAPDVKPPTLLSRNGEASGMTMSDRYQSLPEGYVAPFIHIVGNDPRANRINATIERELNSMQPFPPRAPTSLGTVLCFDTSASIGQQGLQKMKRQALEFIDGIEDMVQAHELEENIGVVAFGATSRIEHHLSNDYASVRDAIERLELGGQSPLFEAILVCICCIKRRGGIINLSGVVALRPRLIIFTDGNASNESDTGVRDVRRTDTQVKMQIIDLLQRLTIESIFPKPVVWVPVGQADRDFMIFLANKSNGFCLEGSDITKLCKYQRVQTTISKVFKCINNGFGTETGTTPNQIQTLLSALGGEFDDEDQREIAQSVTELIEKGVSDSELNTNLELPGLPHLGSRVARGKDWKWDNQDTEGPGTIVSHIAARKDWVLVHWDNGQRSECRYGAEGAFDVKVVLDQPRYNTSDMTFDIGCEVTRGPDWEHRYGFQDGGSGGVGVVIENQLSGLVRVRWRLTSHIDVYRCGQEGKIDLSLRDPIESLKEVTQTDGQMCHGLAEVADKGKPSHEDAASDMDEGDNSWVWQWQDLEGQWRLYSDEENQKLEKVFQRPNASSCLLQRDGKSFRVLFKENQEKSIDDDSRRKVKRTRMNEDDLTVYKEFERRLRRS